MAKAKKRKNSSLEEPARRSKNRAKATASEPSQVAKMSKTEPYQAQPSGSLATNSHDSPAHEQQHEQREAAAVEALEIRDWRLYMSDPSDWPEHLHAQARQPAPIPQAHQPDEGRNWMSEIVEEYMAKQESKNDEGFTGTPASE